MTCNCMSFLKSTQMEGLEDSMTFPSGTAQVRKGIRKDRKNRKNKHKLSRNRAYYGNLDHIRTFKNKP